MKKTILILILSFIFPHITACNRGTTRYRVYTTPDQYSFQKGKNNVVAVKIDIPGGHYIYANPKGPGTGKATRVIAEKHPAITFGTVRYLPGEQHTYPGETDYVNIYQNQTTIFVPVKINNSASDGPATLTLKVVALLCSDSSCIPKYDTITIPVTITKNGPQTQLSDTNSQLYNQSKSSASSILTADPAPANDNDTAKPSLQPVTTFQPRYISETSISGILQAIIFGLIAGFILNFMPCVLPVVSLKVMGFIQHADKDRKQISLLGLTFTGGILTSFAVLAALAAFFGYNWGALFQHNLFLIIMIVLIFALALSMFDVFTLQAPGFANKAALPKANPYIDSYTKGLLATLLATPCSGPFLGGTLAWALTNPPYIIFIIFMSIGTGMALPYLVLSFNPKLIRFIPKPGQWMVTFERIMGFLLLFTAIYLVNIMETKSHIAVITFLGFTGVALWQYGAFGSIGQKPLKRVVSVVALVIIVTAGYQLSFNYLYAENTQEKITSQQFSTDKLYNNRNKTISMVKFTADWCPNCKLVENISLNTAKVKAAIANNKIQLLTADITRPHETAEGLLKELGAHSIPVLAIFPVGEDFRKPIILRDIYSEDDVLAAINLALKSKATTRGDGAGFKFKLDLGK